MSNSKNERKKVKEMLPGDVIGIISTYAPVWRLW
jgi:hypothetical protein